MKATAAILLALAAAISARADEAPHRRYELPNLDTLEMILPGGWQDETDLPPGGTPLTIRLYPIEGARFEVFVTPESPEPTAGDVRDTEALREAVRDAAVRIQPQATEESIEIRRLQGASGIGFYFAATDRAPQPEEFRYMNQGALQAGELTLWFSILTNDGQEAVVADTLAMLRSAVHRRTGLDQR
ncbi:MAG: hypothetical protein AB7T20_08895 [Steroidobacteraceae bacterium]